MSAFPSLPLFTDAFIADTGHLSAQETGAYLMLMMVAWRSPECRLPDADDKLARWARVDRRTWLRIKPSVMEFWTLVDGFWTQKRLSKERDVVSKRAEAARENGRHGGRPKSLENNDATNPAGSARVSGSKAPNPNPNPKQVEPTVLPVGRTRRPKKPLTPINPDEPLSDVGFAFAVERGIPPSEVGTEWLRFVSHHVKLGSEFADWPAAWRTWVLHPLRNKPPNGNGPRGQPTPRTSARDGWAADAIASHDSLMRKRNDQRGFSFDEAQPSGSDDRRWRDASQGVRERASGELVILQHHGDTGRRRALG